MLCRLRHRGQLNVIDFKTGSSQTVRESTDTLINRLIGLNKRVSLSVQAKQFNPILEGGIRFMPEVGDLAPDFELKSHLEKDKKVKLSDFRGQKNVVIAFYPLAWTPV